MTTGLLASVFAQVGLEDGVGFDDVFWFSAGMLSTLALVVFLLRKPFAELKEFVGWWRKFQRDWDGEPAEPGRGQVPGFPERMNRIDGELKRNGGSTIKDQVVKTAAVVEVVAKQVNDLQTQMNTMERRQVKMEKAMERRRATDGTEITAGDD